MPTLVLRCHLGSLLDYFSCISQHFSEGMKVAAAMLGYFHLGKEVAKISKPKIHGWPLFLMAGPCFSPVSPFRKDGCGLPNSNECIPLFFYSFIPFLIPLSLCLQLDRKECILARP